MLTSPRILVVDSSSAGPQLPGVTYYGIEATHSGMCKFESENAPGYRTVSTALREWVADAPQVIPIRWEVEEDDRRMRANLENMERARLYQGPVIAATAAQQHQITTATTTGRFLLPPAGHVWYHAPWPPQGLLLRVVGDGDDEHGPFHRTPSVADSDPYERGAR